MKCQKVKSTNSFDKENYQSLVKKLQSIENEEKRQCGKMAVAQMFHHLNLAINVF